MVRDRDGGCTCLHRTLGLVRTADALDHELAAPLFDEAGDVVPGRRRCAHPGAVGLEEARHGCAAGGEVGHAQVGELLGLEPAHQPLRPSEHVRSVLDCGLQIFDLLGDRRAAPISSMRERPVEREDHADGASVAGSFHASAHRVSVARPVDLKEGLRVRFDDIFERLATEGAEPHRHAPSSGRP